MEPLEVTAATEATKATTKYAIYPLIKKFRKWLFSPSVTKIPNGMVIFITGTNAAGKTTIAAELARKCDNVFSIPACALREFLREYKSESEFEILHKSTFDLDRFEYIQQCELLTPGFIRVVNKFCKWRGAIIEGINILPNIINKYTIEDGRALFFFHLIKNDQSELERNIRLKGFLDISKDRFLKNTSKILVTQTIISEHMIDSDTYNNQNRFSICCDRKTIPVIVDEILAHIEKIIKLHGFESKL